MKVNCTVLLSGGLDSAVALYWALKKNYSVSTLSFDYYRRTQMEKEATLALARFVNCSNRTIQLDFLKEIDDSKEDLKNNALKKAQSAY
ncbi:MAG: 7-cyano-7-deazaguanine synthase, partial [Thaumarchaeota archaeon]|nr:7-cyano-7-deazaguanine synthase [Nitrososphaerota archaeon]